MQTRSTTERIDGRAKLDERDVVSIYTARARGVKIEAIAVRYGIHPEQVRRIVKGQRWKKLYRKYMVEETGEIFQ